jgi:hypothetical protein
MGPPDATTTRARFFDGTDGEARWSFGGRTSFGRKHRSAHPARSAKQTGSQSRSHGAYSGGTGRLGSKTARSRCGARFPCSSYRPSFGDERARRLSERKRCRTARLFCCWMTPRHRRSLPKPTRAPLAPMGASARASVDPVPGTRERSWRRELLLHSGHAAQPPENRDGGSHARRRPPPEAGLPRMLARTGHSSARPIESACGQRTAPFGVSRAR